MTISPPADNTITLARQSDLEAESPVEIIGLELLLAAHENELARIFLDVSVSDETSEGSSRYANDSIDLPRNLTGARRRTQSRRSSNESFANDSLKLAQGRRLRNSSEPKDNIPCEIVVEPIVVDTASIENVKEFTSPQMGVKDRSLLKPVSMANRAA